MNYIQQIGVLCKQIVGGISRSINNLGTKLDEVNKSVNALKEDKGERLYIPKELLDAIKGPKPEKGVDYMTDQDIHLMKEAVLALIPPAENFDEDRFWEKVVELLDVRIRDVHKHVPKYFEISKKEIIKEFKKDISKTLTKAEIVELIAAKTKSISSQITVQHKAAMEDKFESFIRDNPEMLARTLEKLIGKGKKRLDARALKNLSIMPGVGGAYNPGSSGGGVSVNVGLTNITGDIDGVNTSFTLGAAPLTGVLVVFLGQAQLFEGVHFTRVGTALTYTFAPADDLAGEPHKAIIY